MSQPRIAHVMHDYARGAVAYAKRVYGMDLDYSEQSLDSIDAMIAKRIASGVIVPDDLPASEREELWTFCKLLGGYVGEVILRNLGGAWELQDVGDGAGAVSLVVGGVRGSPPEAVWKAHTEDFKAISSYYRTLRAVLGHGDRTTTEGGATTVKLPPFSAEPKPSLGRAKNRPWWRIWRS